MEIINVIKPQKPKLNYIFHIVYIIIILALIFCVWYISYNNFNTDKYRKIEEYTSFSYNINAVLSISEQVAQASDDTSLKSMSITSNGYLDLLNEKHASKDAYSINAFPYVIESYNDKNTTYYYAPTFINKYIIKDDIYSFDTYKNNGVFQTVTFPEELSSVKINSSNNESIAINNEYVECKKIDLILSDSDQLNAVKNYISLLSQKYVFFDLEKPLSALQSVSVNSFTFSIFESNGDIIKIECSSFLNVSDKIVSMYYSIELYDINETKTVDFPTLTDNNSVKESSILQAVG